MTMFCIKRLFQKGIEPIEGAQVTHLWVTWRMNGYYQSGVLGKNVFASIEEARAGALEQCDKEIEKLQKKIAAVEEMKKDLRKELK